MAFTAKRDYISTFFFFHILMDAMQISLAPSISVHLWQWLLGWNEDKK